MSLAYFKFSKICEGDFSFGVTESIFVSQGVVITLWSHESSKSNFMWGGLEKEKLKKDALQINARRTKIIVWKCEGEN